MDCGLPEHSARPKGHADRVEFLASLAMLFGCAQDAGHELPDGRRPDVTRLDSRSALLFIGEAKDTESPGNVETQVRLLSYLKWIKAYVDEPGRLGVLAVCFGTAGHTLSWGDTLDFLSREVGLVATDSGSQRFDAHTRVVWRSYARPKARREH